PEIFAREGMRFESDDVQPFAAARIAAPGLPQGEKVIAQPESRLADGERFFSPPSFGKAIAVKKDPCSLFESSPLRMIDIAKHRTEGYTLFAECNSCRNQRFVVI